MLAARMLFRGVISEGVSCSGKTSALRALMRSPVFVDRPGLSTVVMTEHQTQRVLEGVGPSRVLDPDRSVALLSEHVTYVRGRQSWLLGDAALG
jgi:hypothetical protein